MGKNAVGIARPNPAVGAVIVQNNQIIGEGFTSEDGGPHAEVNAINSVKEKSLLIRPICNLRTLVITEELLLISTNHSGKNWSRSYWHKDPFDKVAGKECHAQRGRHCSYRRYLRCIMQETPQAIFDAHITETPLHYIKMGTERRWIYSPAGRATSKKEPFWISNSFSKQIAHQLRAKESAIMVGTNTVIRDNPKLDIRHWTEIPFGELL